MVGDTIHTALGFDQPKDRSVYGRPCAQAHAAQTSVMVLYSWCAGSALLVC
jgi:hypothetical protein